MDSSSSFTPDAGDPLSTTPEKGSSPDPSFPIINRPSPSLWWLVLAGSLDTVLCFGAPFFPAERATPSDRQGEFFMMWLMGFTFSAALIYLGLKLSRDEIRADETGLTWRTAFSGWKSVEWDEITDYYIDTTWRLIFTPVGKISLSKIDSGSDRIADLVPTRAVNAPRQGWQYQGSKSNQAWSQTFTPWTSNQKWMAPIASGALLFCVVSFSYLAYSPHQNTTPSFSDGRPTMGFWYDNLPIIFLSVFGTAFVVGIGLSMWLMWRERHYAWHRRDEKLIVNNDGLVFTSDTQRVAAKWAQVEKLNYGVKRYHAGTIVFTTSQGSFELWLENQNNSVLKQIVFNYAPHLLQEHQELQKRKEIEANDIEGEAGAWSGGTPGEGARRWSFRSAGNKFVLGCITFALPFVPFLYFVTRILTLEDDVPKPPSRPLLWSLVAGCVFIIVAGWLRYFRGEVSADETGLRVRGPLGRSRHVAWSGIQAVGRDACGEFVRTSHGKTHLWFLMAPVRVGELRELIQERVKGEGQ